jgi:putative transcriptional regulator
MSDGSGYPSMAPCLLLAVPQLNDPNFNRSVVLLVENQEHGSVGLVLNQATDFKVDEVMESLSCSWQGPKVDCIWNGGPVLKEQCWILHEKALCDLYPAPVEVSPGIYLSGTLDQLEPLSEHPPPKIKFFLGSSGWGENQLETEIAQGWWLTLEVDPDLVFKTKSSQLWEKSFRSMGIDPGSFVFNNTIQ